MCGETFMVTFVYYAYIIYTLLITFIYTPNTVGQQERTEFPHSLKVTLLKENLR